LLAFSCKRRGFCPSCAGRRMAQTAAHVFCFAEADLVAQVIPWVPTRQYIRSKPISLTSTTGSVPSDSWQQLI
jgi:hypothetical protein